MNNLPCRDFLAAKFVSIFDCLSLFLLSIFFSLFLSFFFFKGCPSHRDGFIIFQYAQVIIKTKNKTNRNTMSRIWTTDPCSGKQGRRTLYHSAPPFFFLSSFLSKESKIDELNPIKDKSNKPLWVNILPNIQYQKKDMTEYLQIFWFGGIEKALINEKYNLKRIIYCKIEGFGF